MPFCEASRVTMPTSGVCGGELEVSCREQAAFVDRFARQIERRVVHRQIRVVAGIPFAIIDPVQDADHPIGACPKRPLQAHARRRMADLTRVRGTHRRDRIGKFYPCFQRVDDAVREILGIEPGSFGPQSDVFRRRGRNDSLIADVMDGQHRSRMCE